MHVTVIKQSPWKEGQISLTITIISCVCARIISDAFYIFLSFMLAFDITSLPKPSFYSTNLLFFPSTVGSTSYASINSTQPKFSDLIKRIANKMDTHDVSNIDQYMKMLDRQKATLKAAMAHQGKRPTDMKSRRELIFKFMVMSMAIPAQDTFQLHSSFVPPPYPPSTMRLEGLKPTYIKDLKLGVHHRGSYLLVRSLTPPNRMTAIMAVVEDEREDAVVLQLYQQPDEKVRSATSVIAKDDVFLIKEPFFKIMGDGEYGLRVDHVSDLVCISPCHNMMPKQWSPRVLDVGKTAGDWKQEGDDAMKRKQYSTAIQRYIQCIPLSSRLVLADFALQLYYCSRISSFCARR